MSWKDCTSTHGTHIPADDIAPVFTETWLARAFREWHLTIMQRFSPANLSRRQILTACGTGAAVMSCGVLPGVTLPALAETATPWVRGMHSGFRLVHAGPADDTGLSIAILQIALDKGFKTYWRTPGDSGIPPSFDFTGSGNAGEISVHFPAPIRFADGAGGHSIGYLGPMVELPVTFRPVNPKAPVKLALKMDYAVCEKICVPASGAVVLAAPAAAALSARAVKLMAETLPRKQPVGAAEPITIVALRKGPEPEHFTVDAALPAGRQGDLFVEGENPWLFDSKAGVSPSHGLASFTVMAIDRDKTPDCRGVEVVLTLVSENRAIETKTWLDVKLLSA
jgi:DsbC/DsbD-like thiol-disulfide interchange protein